MEKEEEEKTKMLISILADSLKFLKEEEIEYDYINRAISSLKRKLNMGENPYKFKSSANYSSIYGDLLNLGDRVEKF